MRPLVRAHTRAFLPNIFLRKAGFEEGEEVQTPNGVGVVEEAAGEGEAVLVRFPKEDDPDLQFQTFKGWQVSPSTETQPEEPPPIRSPQPSLRN